VKIHRLLASLLLWAATSMGADKKYNCNADGRYWMHHDRGEKIYCFDGEGYAEGAAPKHVKSFFQPKQQGTGFSNGDGSAPIGSEPEKPEIRKPAVRGGGGGGGIGGGGGMGGGGGDVPPDWDPGRRVAGRGVAENAESSSAEPPPVNSALIGDVYIGMDRKAVLALLGRPHGAVMNVSVDGVLQVLSYVTPDGTASIKLLSGRVVAIRQPR